MLAAHSTRKHFFNKINSVLYDNMHTRKINKKFVRSGLVLPLSNKTV